jgi:hypothetical protein
MLYVNFCLNMLYYHSFKCQIHLKTVKFDVAPMRIRYRVTGALGVTQCWNEIFA